jgi:glucosamine 6-phosphate synthetase-like amidotransferase/phosphosugar isomerase protein
MELTSARLSVESAIEGDRRLIVEVLLADGAVCDRQLASVLSLAEIRSEVKFRSGLAEAVRNILYLPVGQLKAFKRSVSKGLDPDRPTNLDAVVKL